MRLKDYGRNCKLRKAYVQSPGLLMVGVDIGKASHSACFGTKTGTVAVKFDFAHDRDGFDKFERIIRKLHFNTKSKRILIGMEPICLLLLLFAFFFIIKQDWCAL